MPLNDKGINDALENGISDCLRSLQKSNQGLLLSAQQLKRADRDVKFIPCVAGAIASVLGRSRQEGVYTNAIDVASGWDEQVRRMGVPGFDGELESDTRMRARRQSVLLENSSEVNTRVDEERLKVDDLRLILERRIRFVVSDEFKDAKRAEEKEMQRMERTEMTASKKRAKKNRVVQTDDMRGDCFDSSDGSDCSDHSNVRNSANDGNEAVFSQNFDSDVNSPVIHARHCGRTTRRASSGSTIGSSDSDSSGAVHNRLHRGKEGTSCNSQKRGGGEGGAFRSDVLSQASSEGDNSIRVCSEPTRRRCDNSGASTSQRGRSQNAELGNDEFADGYESSPRHPTTRQRYKL